VNLSLVTRDAGRHLETNCLLTSSLDCGVVCHFAPLVYWRSVSQTRSCCGNRFTITDTNFFC